MGVGTKALKASLGRGSGEGWSQGWGTPRRSELPRLTAAAGHPGPHPLPAQPTACRALVPAFPVLRLDPLHYRPGPTSHATPSDHTVSSWPRQARNSRNPAPASAVISGKPLLGHCPLFSHCLFRPPMPCYPIIMILYALVKCQMSSKSWWRGGVRVEAPPHASFSF